MLNYLLYLIRHGITNGNLEGKYIGITDLPLCDEGFAVISGYKESGFYPDVGKVYSSPLKRCLETAEIIYQNRDVYKIDNLRECDFGDFEGKTTAELENLPKYTEWLKGRYNSCPPNGENYGDFTLRCVKGLEEIFFDMMREKTTSAALITHGGVIMNLLSGYGLPKAKPAEYAVNQGEGFAIRLTPFLWQNGPAFEIVGKIF